MGAQSVPGTTRTSFPTPNELTKRWLSPKKSMLSHIEEPAPQCQSGNNPLSQGTFRGMLKHAVLTLNKVLISFLIYTCVWSSLYWLQLLVSPAIAIQHVLFVPRVNGEQTKDDRSNLAGLHCWSACQNQQERTHFEAFST